MPCHLSTYGTKTKSAHLLRWHYGERVTIRQFSNSFPKHFSYLCEYAFRFDLSCSFRECPIIFHCLHCSPSCFDPDSLLLAHLWLGLSWIDCISTNKRFSSPKTSSRKPYTSSKQQERQKHSAETTINFSPPPGTRTPRCRPAARSPHRACRPRGQSRAATPARPRPQHVDSGPQQPAQWAGSGGRGSA